MRSPGSSPATGSIGEGLTSDSARSLARLAVIGIGVLAGVWLLSILGAWLWAEFGIVAAGIVFLGALLISAYWAYRRRRLGLTSVVGVVALAVAWSLAELAISTDWHDADGFADCFPSCSGVQRTVGFVFFSAPAAVALFVLALVFSRLLGGRRQRGAAPDV